MTDFLFKQVCVERLLLMCDEAFRTSTCEACIGYFGIRVIGLFFKGYWDICVFLFWDMGYSGILGYGILEFILGYELN